MRHENGLCDDARALFEDFPVRQLGDFVRTFLPDRLQRVTGSAFALTASNDASSARIEKFVDEIHCALKGFPRQDLFLMKTRGCTIFQGHRFALPEA